MSVPLRFPSAQELENEYQAYEAEMLARQANPVPYAPRDQDEREDVPRPPVAARVFCPECGLRFDHANRQVALMTRGRHRKAEHPDAVEAI